MAELLEKILSLPRIEQLKIMAAMVAHLQKEESKIPEWQIKVAGEALKEIDEHPDLLISNTDFWKEVDEKIASLEQTN